MRKYYLHFKFISSQSATYFPFFLNTSKNTPYALPKIELSVSINGVKLLNVKTKEILFNYDIKHINNVCQDQDDLNYFAFSTQTDPSSHYYCHVFSCKDKDLSTQSNGHIWDNLASSGLLGSSLNENCWRQNNLTKKNYLGLSRGERDLLLKKPLGGGGGEGGLGYGRREYGSSR
ncbi:ankyrin repeat and SAM domain-containing 1A-like isoform X3 [Brachionus plicatilis]|uniref:Ankyrin repeat and SAM domain-containing 1A-like isoform X3 n=1 Tax=Brachionus plicatilis TaxID=10195 RepID=A0A3M7PNP0_BRAPC|nr:ankyrin repeat and SAM domain-containing 1A-like isoform X3 [Brachionus plicatilis]